MTLKERNINNKMRSYSSIFSSTSFSKLIKEDDFSFINSKILRYDNSKIGVKIHTYADYIKYTYNELRKQYRNEYIYKNTFINEILINDYSIKDTIVINEFRVGNSIADLVMFNGTSKAFEIKTELDTDKRLSGQLIDYKKAFKECYIVTHKSLTSKYLKEDNSIGIIELIETPRGLKMQEVRPAIENKEVDPETIMRCLRTNEYKSIVKKYYKELPEMNSFNMFNICKELMFQIPNDILNLLFIEQLKFRKSNTSKINTHIKELRQIGIALNLDANLSGQLITKLNTPIKL
jgi:hypothetical protein